MKIGVLTSSRADYGIYLPLLKALKKDPYFNLDIICFGTHLSTFHGYTLKKILEEGFEVSYKIESMLAGDSPNAIATSMALTELKFADFWKDHQKDFDLVICLGDRYEMFSAVMAGVPFGIKFVHLHGGEKTLGAVDNIFRHSITLASCIHFVSCEEHAARVAELIEKKDIIYVVGALALDNLASMSYYTKIEFYNQFNVDLEKPTVLVTVHPETVMPERNTEYAEIISEVMLKMHNFQFLITLPNADTNGMTIRNRFLRLPAETGGRVICHENLGTRGYFTAMKHCSFLLGNTSSGIIEAASFRKWVINLGSRQLGRAHSKNILNSAFSAREILLAAEKIKNDPVYSGGNIFYKDNASNAIIDILKKYNERISQ